MQYSDLRQFIDYLESIGELKRIPIAVDPVLEITEICDRTLKQGGPALLFENVKGSDLPVLANLAGRHASIRRSMSFHGGMQDSVVAEDGEVRVDGNKVHSHRVGAWWILQQEVVGDVILEVK